MDLRLEQVIQHVRTNIGHMRRNDNAGKALIASRIGHQVMSGMSRPFYTYGKNELPYLPKDTRWTYMWKTIQEYNLNIQIHEEWLPKKKYGNDKYIMEVAAKDEYFNSKKFKLEAINNCRIYTKIFTYAVTD